MNGNIGDYFAAVLAGGVHKFTRPNNPGPVPCIVCRVKDAVPSYFPELERWFCPETCSKCMDLERLEEGRMSASKQADEWQRNALGKSGLHAAELSHDPAWMDSRMRGLHFGGDQLTDEERKQPNWRYVHGLPGTGTSAQLALAVRWYIEKRRKRCLMQSCAAMAESLRPDMGCVVQDYIDPPLLAIDKFGIGITQHGGDQVSRILDERKRRLRPTIIASTMPLGAGGDDPGMTVEEHPFLGNGTVAAMIFGQTGGHRGTIHLTQSRRVSMRPRRISTRQQRQLQAAPEPRRQQRDIVDVI